MSKFILNPEEIAPLREMIGGIAAAYDFAEDPEFLMEAAVAAHEMPRRLRSALIRFKLDEPDSAVLIVSGFPVDDGKIRATREHWERPSRRRPPTLEEEIFFVFASSLLGDCIGWSSQQGGYIIHDVMPIQGNENEQI